jgi:hypothetical protein
VDEIDVVVCVFRRYSKKKGEGKVADQARKWTHPLKTRPRNFARVFFFFFFFFLILNSPTAEILDSQKSTICVLGVVLFSLRLSVINLQ